MTRGIVVDTCVARAASTSEGGPAKPCRDCLDALYAGGLSLVMTRQLWEEWLKQRKNRPAGSYYLSSYTYIWLTNMLSRKRVLWFTGVRRDQLRAQVLAAADVQAHDQVHKDLHLIETALASDERILSKDRPARRHFCGAAQKVQELRPILWVDALRDRAAEWLRSGAPDLPEYCLGYRAAPCGSPL